MPEISAHKINAEWLVNTAGKSFTVSTVKTGLCFMLAAKQLFVTNVSQACRSAVPDDVLMLFAIDYVTIYWKTLWHFAKAVRLWTPTDNRLLFYSK